MTLPECIYIFFHSMTAVVISGIMSGKAELCEGEEVHYQAFGSAGRLFRHITIILNSK